MGPVYEKSDRPIKRKSTIAVETLLEIIKHTLESGDDI